MKIKSLFTQDEELSIDSILQKYGIQNVKEYLKGNTVEPTTNYDNIDEWCGLINKYVNGGGQNVN